MNKLVPPRSALKWRFRNLEFTSTITLEKNRDVNKDLTLKDQDQDKDLTPKDQDQDKDLTPKDQDKDLTPRTRTRT